MGACHQERHAQEHWTTCAAALPGLCSDVSVPELRGFAGGHILVPARDGLRRLVDRVDQVARLRAGGSTGQLSTRRPGTRGQARVDLDRDPSSVQSKRSGTLQPHGGATPRRSTGVRPRIRIPEALLDVAIRARDSSARTRRAAHVFGAQCAPARWSCPWAARPARAAAARSRTSACQSATRLSCPA